MKKIKIILTAAIAALTLTAFSVGASAEVIEPSTESTKIEEVINGTENDEKIEQVVEIDGTSDGTFAEKADEDNPTDVTEETHDEEFFPTLYAACLEHADDIFAALAFIGTLAVSIVCKKGLIPTISRATVGIRDTLERGRVQNSDEYAKLQSSLEGLEGAIKTSAAEQKDMQACVEKLKKSVDSLTTDELEREKLKLILTSQVDMLYEIFMASAIPQYQKDAASARIHSMREELGAYDLSEK